MTDVTVRRIVAMAFVADVPRSCAFYAKLGFAVAGTHAPPQERAPVWAWLQADGAALMVARASEPVVPEQQAVLFYLYVDDVAATHAALAGAGLAVGGITRPFYAPHGEFRLADPDGYTLMVTHV